jgi:hypothetical protein
MATDENQYTTVRIKRSTKKDLEVLRSMIVLKTPDKAPLDLDGAIELIEKEYFDMMISRHPEMKKLLKHD